MTLTTTTSTAMTGASRTFARLTAAEWTKLRSVRSTTWTLAATIVASVGLAVLLCAVNAHEYPTLSAGDRASWDPTLHSLAGILIGQIALGVLGVLAITSEFATGTIRTSVAAAPRRSPLIVAKAAVYGTLALIVGEATSLLSFLAGQAVMSGHAPTAALTDPHVAAAVALTGIYCALISLIALGLGLLLRHTAAGIIALVAVLLVIPGIISALPSVNNGVGRFLPEAIVANSLAPVVSQPNALSATVGLLCLIAYAGVVLVVGTYLFKRRDV
jgi:ABC-2 type transport system permease protein